MASPAIEKLENFAADSRVPVLAAWAALSLAEVVVDLGDKFNSAQTYITETERRMVERFGRPPEDFQPAGFKPKSTI